MAIQIFCTSPKIWLHLVPLQKLLCQYKKQFYWMQIIFFVWHKTFVTAKKCKLIFGLSQKIWTSPKHFGTCKRTRHNYHLPDDWGVGELDEGGVAGGLVPGLWPLLLLPPLIDTFKCERRANGLGLEFDPAASPFLVMVRPEEGALAPPEPPSPPPEPTNEIPESLLSLFMLLLSDPLALALLRYVWQLCAEMMSWVRQWVELVHGCLITDTDIFILFAENSQILLKISVIVLGYSP